MAREWCTQYIWIFLAKSKYKSSSETTIYKHCISVSAITKDLKESLSSKIPNPNTLEILIVLGF